MRSFEAARRQFTMIETMSKLVIAGGLIFAVVGAAGAAILLTLATTRWSL